MKCPYCGEEMQKGYIQCRDGVYWSSKKRPVAAIPPLNKEAVHLHGYEDDIPEAWNCPACRKVILEYGPKPE